MLTTNVPEIQRTNLASTVLSLKVCVFKQKLTSNHLCENMNQNKFFLCVCDNFANKSFID